MAMEIMSARRVVGARVVRRPPLENNNKKKGSKKF